jgi:hypothetical protein
MNLNVWELTNDPGIPSVAIFGMWQATHWLPRTSVLMMGMLFQGRSVRAVRRRWAVAVQAELLRRFAELRIILGAVHVMARGAGDPVSVHDALYEVIALHPVLVGGPVGKMGKSCLTQRVVFQLPIFRKMEAGAVANGPVISLAFDLLGERPALRVACDPSVI